MNRIIRDILPIPLLAFLITLTGCSNENTLVPENTGKPMEFNSKVAFEDEQATSRASEMANGTQIGLFGYYTGQSTWAVAGATTEAKVMYNRLGTFTTGTGVDYSPKSYWTGITNDKYTFFGFAPRNDANITTATTNTDKGIPAINVTVKNTAIQQSDVITAVTTDCTYGDADDGDASRVKLPFTHAMTRIRFSIAYATPTSIEYYVTVKEVRIKQVKNTARLELATNYTTNTPVWKNHTGSVTCTSTPTAPIVVPYKEEATILNDLPSFYLIPQTNTAIVIEMDYEVRIDGDATVYTRTSSFVTSTGTLWTVGKAVCYQITIYPSQATWKIQVEQWDTKTVTGITTNDDTLV